MPASSRRCFLSISIQNYTNAGPAEAAAVNAALRRLTNAEADAVAMETFFQQTQGARELRNIQDVNKALKKFKEQVEVDPQLYLLAWLLKKETKVIVVYLVGHGITAADGSARLLLRDAKTWNDGSDGVFLEVDNLLNQLLAMDSYAAAVKTNWERATWGYGTWSAFQVGHAVATAHFADFTVAPLIMTAVSCSVLRSAASRDRLNGGTFRMLALAVMGASTLFLLKGVMDLGALAARYRLQTEALLLAQVGYAATAAHQARQLGRSCASHGKTCLHPRCSWAAPASSVVPSHWEPCGASLWLRWPMSVGSSAMADPWAMEIAADFLSKEY
eukprot:Skav202329  [mRNA]  locus=scaffold60:402438:414497:+ [translate_table: standard]